MMGNTHGTVIGTTFHPSGQSINLQIRIEANQILEIASNIITSTLKEEPYDLMALKQHTEQLLRSHCHDLKEPLFLALFFDDQYRLLEMEEVCRGPLTYSPLIAKQLVQRLRQNEGTAYISCAHYRKDLTKIARDVEAVRQIQTALKDFEVKLLDYYLLNAKRLRALEGLQHPY